MAVTGARAGEAGRLPRADARRNVAAIVDAAADLLARDPSASVAEIAKAAGVGRVTLYGHFPTRAELVDAVVERVVRAADAMLEETDTAGDPDQALARMVSASWQLVHQFTNVMFAAQHELSAERMRGVHDRVLRRLQAIIEGGQQAGRFRRDLPESWLLAVAMSLMHTAAAEAAADRITAQAAPQLVTASMLALLAVPA